MQLKQYGKGKYYGSFLALGLIGAALLTAASGQVDEKSKAEPLMIQEQGSFAVGGKVITNSGTFNEEGNNAEKKTGKRAILKF